MTKAVWLLAGVLMVAGAAQMAQAAQDEVPMAPFTDFSRSGLGVRVLPGAAEAPDSKMLATPQSPDALACANTNGITALEARIEGCTKLIDLHRWKGNRIAWAYANRCSAESRLGRTDRALADCAEAIDQDPELALAWQLRGEIHDKRGELDKAQEDFDKAVALGEKNTKLFASRGTVLLLKGDAEKALADFEQEVALAGGDSAAWLDRGSAQLGVGDAAKAEADFAKATQLSPGNAQAWFNRAAAALSAGDKAQAIDDFKRVLKLDPQQVYAALWLFLARDGSAQAKADLQAFAGKAANKDWPFAVTQLYLGAADPAQTLAAATAAAAKGGDPECEARFYLGAHDLLKGAKDDAAVTLGRAVASCPKNFIEYFGAKAELKKLEAAKPAAGAPAAAQVSAPAKK